MRQLSAKLMTYNIESLNVGSALALTTNMAHFGIDTSLVQGTRSHNTTDHIINNYHVYYKHCGTTPQDLMAGVGIVISRKFRDLFKTVKKHVIVPHRAMALVLQSKDLTVYLEVGYAPGEHLSSDIKAAFWRPFNAYLSTTGKSKHGL